MPVGKKIDSNLDREMKRIMQFEKLKQKNSDNTHSCIYATLSCILYLYAYA